MMSEWLHSQLVEAEVCQQLGTEKLVVWKPYLVLSCLPCSSTGYADGNYVSHGTESAKGRLSSVFITGRKCADSNGTGYLCAGRYALVRWKIA